MIALVRQNGHEVFVNPDLIESAERDDDENVTVVVLTTGNTLVVTDPTTSLVEKIVEFRRRFSMPEP